MNFRRHSPQRRRDIYLNLTSMIDVMFNLLVFFFAASVLAMPESYLNSALDASRASASSIRSAADLSPQVLTVRAGPSGRGTYILGDRPIPDRAVLLQLLRNLPKDPGVVVRVHDDVTIEFAVAAMQTCRDAGFEKVTYVPESP